MNQNTATTEQQGFSDTLHEVDRRYYGGNGGAIERHAERTYKLSSPEDSALFILDRSLSFAEPCYEVYETSANLKQLFPITSLEGERYWGDGLSWEDALKEFTKIIAHSMSEAHGVPVTITMGEPLNADEMRAYEMKHVLPYQR